MSISIICRKLALPSLASLRRSQRNLRETSAFQKHNILSKERFIQLTNPLKGHLHHHEEMAIAHVFTAHWALLEQIATMLATQSRLPRIHHGNTHISAVLEALTSILQYGNIPWAGKAGGRGKHKHLDLRAMSYLMEAKRKGGKKKRGHTHRDLNAERPCSAT